MFPRPTPQRVYAHVFTSGQGDDDNNIVTGGIPVPYRLLHQSFAAIVLHHVLEWKNKSQACGQQCCKSMEADSREPYRSASKTCMQALDPGISLNQLGCLQIRRSGGVRTETILLLPVFLDHYKQKSPPQSLSKHSRLSLED